MRNGRYPLPPLRPELQAAHDEMDAKGITSPMPCAAPMTARLGK